MGVPKFYRWASERYPLLNAGVAEHGCPELDNVYLDMNGVVHNCTHGGDGDSKASEEEMMGKIFAYLERIVAITKPRKLLYMAIDGCAPRAKMNQQRARRFRAANEAADAVEALRRRGEPIPDAESAFDSNCITPGTPFMARLQEGLKFFVRRKIKEDELWQDMDIILSGHDVPGEGEHKILEYIRWARTQPWWEPNQRHCMYGLDADLIMLALCTHEPHFILLREKVEFGGGRRGAPVKEALDVRKAAELGAGSGFVIFHVGLMRDYLEEEFRDDTLPFGFDLERTIDDFVFFAMFVGNDFLPTLPTLDISEGALDNMLAIYKEELPRMGGYLTNAGVIDFERTERFFARLGALEQNVLEKRAEEAEKFANRGKSNGRRGGPGRGPSQAAPKPGTSSVFDALEESVGLSVAELAAEGEEASDALRLPKSQAPEMMNSENRSLIRQYGVEAFKVKYYSTKLKLSAPEARETRDTLAREYLVGLSWVLLYYYNGVASWNWFYPHHYAPMASDLRDLSRVCAGLADLDESALRPAAFPNPGQPFMPFEQLMAVLPAASHRLLPPPYRELMLSPTSPIASLYPEEVAVDVEGKRQDWEAVVLLDFIDQDALLSVVRSVDPARLTQAELMRNMRGTPLLFRFDAGVEDEVISPFPARWSNLRSSHSVCVPQQVVVTTLRDRFKPMLSPGTVTGAVNPPGFPSLKTLAHKMVLTKAAVNVFGSNSKKESAIITIPGLELVAGLNAETVAAALGVGKGASAHHIFVDWPYVREGRITAVSDSGTKVKEDGSVIKLDVIERSSWQRAAADAGRRALTTMGIDCGSVSLMVHARVEDGVEQMPDGSVAKRFAAGDVMGGERLFPLQLILRRDPNPDVRVATRSAPERRELARRYPIGSRAIYLGKSFYSDVVRVAERDEAAGVLHVEVLNTCHAVSSLGLQADEREQLPTHRVLGAVQTRWMRSGEVARKLNVSPSVLGKLSGSVAVKLPGGVDAPTLDLGLNLRAGNRDLFIPDYARKAPPRTSDDGSGPVAGGWEYSAEAVALMEEYKSQFEWVFKIVELESEARTHDLGKHCPRGQEEVVEKQVALVQRWLKSLPISKRPQVPAGSVVAPQAAVSALEQATPPRPPGLRPALRVERIEPRLLLRPTEMRLGGGLSCSLEDFALGDRVVSFRSTGLVPFGLRGTLVGVYGLPDPYAAPQRGSERASTPGEGSQAPKPAEALEVLWDSEFEGGTTLHGRCQTRRGGIVPVSSVLNLSKPCFVKPKELKPKLMGTVAPPVPPPPPPPPVMMPMPPPPPGAVLVPGGMPPPPGMVPVGAAPPPPAMPAMPHMPPGTVLVPVGMAPPPGMVPVGMPPAGTPLAPQGPPPPPPPQETASPRKVQSPKDRPAPVAAAPAPLEEQLRRQAKLGEETKEDQEDLASFWASLGTGGPQAPSVQAAAAGGTGRGSEILGLLPKGALDAIPSIKKRPS